MSSFRRTFDSISGNWDKTQSNQETEEQNILGYLSKDEINRQLMYEHQGAITSIVLLMIIVGVVIIGVMIK